MSFFLLAIVYPWILTVCIVVLLTTTILLVPRLTFFFLKMPLKYKILLVLTIIIGGLLRFYFVPNFHRIYYDEDRYLSYTVSFARFNNAVSVDVATSEKSIMGVPDSAGRTTVPVINGWILKLFGYSENNLFEAAKVFSTLQIILVFILCLLLFKNYLTAFLSSLGMALLPTNIYWSSSINLDAYAVFFALLSLIGSVLYARLPTTKNTLFALLSFFLLLGVRIESFVFLPVILFAIYAVRKDQKLPILTKKDYVFIASLLIILLFRGFLSISVIGQKWCCAEALPLEVFAPNYFIRNLLPNIQSLFLRPELPISLTLFAGAALLYRSGKTRLVLGLWIVLYFLLYSTYYAGSFFTFEFSGSYGRYLLMLIPGLIILASLTITDIITKIKRKDILSCIFALVFVISIIPTTLNYKTLISSSPYFNFVEEGPKILHEFLENGILKNTPKNSVIIHTLTGFTLLEGRTSVFIGYFFERDEVMDFVKTQLEDGREVYLFETYTCDIFPERCKKIKRKFKFTRLNLKEGESLGLDVSKVELIETTVNTSEM